MNTDRQKDARAICYVSGAGALLFLLIAIWSNTANVGWRCAATSAVLAIIAVVAYFNSDM